MKKRIRFSFKGKNQLPLFMVIKEYYDDNGEIEFAKVLFEIKGKEMRQLEKKMLEQECSSIANGEDLPTTVERGYCPYCKMTARIYKNQCCNCGTLLFRATYDVGWEEQ